MACTCDMSGAYGLGGGRPEGKKPLARHRRNGKDTMKMELQEVGLGGMDWIDLYKDWDILWGGGF